MIKIVNLNIQPNENSDLWVDWSELNMQEDSSVVFEQEEETEIDEIESYTPEPSSLQIIATDKEQMDPEPLGDESLNNKDDNGGGCLIATAAYGSELAPQVQFLREVRDDTLLSTTSGTLFMTEFNSLYYSFSPVISDMERENPVFREAVKLFITPMLSTLSIMTLADEGSESSVLGLGISVIVLNLGMYIAGPTVIAFTIKKRMYR